MTNLKKVLAANIKAYRKKMGLSQAQLAEKVGIATRYLAVIETCKSFPTPEMLERIAEGLELDTLDLLSLYSQQYEWKDMVVKDIGAFVDKKMTEISVYIDKKLNGKNRP